MLSQKQKKESEALRDGLKQVLLNNPAQSNADAAREFLRVVGKGSYNTLRLLAKEIREELPQESPQALIDADLLRRSEKAKEKFQEAKYDALLKKFEEVTAQNDFLLGISAPCDPISIKPHLGKDKNEASVLFMLSDWHFEERVDKETINGLNEYNLEIAEARWDKCAQNFLKLVKKERLYSKIENLILWLGGDFITGYIHEELEESNYLSPIEASLFAKERIISLINFLKKEGDFANIYVTCNYGNHGRLHKKPRISTGYKNNFEWMIYRDISKLYPDLVFQIPDGLYNFVEIYDRVLRTSHGDHIGYGGGIGGLTIPLTKAIMRADQQRKADYNIIGHFHQFWQASKNCDVNGSGIGFNAYAQRIGAQPEEPMQGMLLFDKKYGLVQRMPVFCK